MSDVRTILYYNELTEVPSYDGRYTTIGINTGKAVEGEGGVDDFYLGRQGWVEIRYVNGNMDLIPISQVIAVKKEYR